MLFVISNDYEINSTMQFSGVLPRMWPEDDQ